MIPVYGVSNDVNTFEWFSPGRMGQEGEGRVPLVLFPKTDVKGEREDGELPGVMEECTGGGTTPYGGEGPWTPIV